MRTITQPRIGRSWPRSRVLHMLYSVDQMRAALDRERARADRTEREFSLAVFTMQPANRRAMYRLARLIFTRARTIDEVGWLDRHQICAVLPETSSFGAACFARNICEIAERRALGVSAAVYTYPSRWFGDRYGDQDRADGEGNGDGHGDEQTVDVPRRAAGPAGSRADKAGLDGAERHALLRSASAGFEAQMDQGRPPAPVQRLFVRPNPWWKRLTDIVGALFALVLFGPLMLLVALVIKLTSPGPVLFRQQRAGAGGRPFTIYKFRTMFVGAHAQQALLRQQNHNEQDGPAFKLRRDPRVTRLGRMLRCTSLDELPQLFNILKGNMSLVGPRPLPMAEAEGCVRWQQQRLDVTPGLTCIWQVKGRSSVTFNEWIRMDMNYIRGQSFFRDVKLLLETIPAVLLRRGAH